MICRFWAACRLPLQLQLLPIRAQSSCFEGDWLDGAAEKIESLLK